MTKENSMSQQDRYQEMRAQLRAADSQTATLAVAFFVQQRMPEPLIELLKAGGNDVRFEAVRGLAAIGDRAAVLALADLLEAEREPIGESEDATMHRNLMLEALRAASQLSGESFDVEDINDERQILAAVQRIREKHGEV
jgi:HEAT repeat protein